MGISTVTSAHHIRRLAPTVVAAVLAAAYLILHPPGADLPAQLLRAKLFDAEGFGLWNNWWYGGQDITSYSVLFPPLAWLLGPQVVAAVASVGTAAAFEALTYDVLGDDAWLGACWLGAATVTELLSGRLTFALGLCGAALTALLLERRRPRSAAVLACATTLASPVAALCAALAAAVAIRRGVRGRLRIDIAGGIAVISVCLALFGMGTLAFPQSGHQPFAVGALWPLLLAGALLAVVAQRSSHRAVSFAVVLYLCGCLAAFEIPTPVGGNAARLGQLLAGPLAALLLVPRRSWLLLALAALPLTYLQVHDAVVDLEHGSQADTSAYYRPLIGFLNRQHGIWRVEVPFTRGHWESYWLAPRFPLARGWERQSDIAEDRLFYAARLISADYDAWLHRLAVRYVAVADAPPDYSARGELRLIRDRPPYLRVIARLRDWTVYAVRDPTVLASGAGRLVSMGLDTLTLDVRRPGRIRLRVRWSPYWQLSGISGCVMADGGFTQVHARTRGTAHLAMGFALGRIGSRAPRCN